MLRSATLVCLLASAGLAQDPAALFEKAPPDIDGALRARVAQFYEFHKEGKFRAADELVAEDSKDVFFGMDKPRCREFALGSIKYSENFTRAQAMISCDTEMVMPMMPPFPVKRPISSKWKAENGQWFWYVDPPAPAADTTTPFGIRKAQEPGTSSAPPDVRGLFVNMNTVTSGVKADKAQLVFDPDSAAAAEVVFTNELPGSVKLSLEARESKGLSFKLDRTALASRERAVLSVRYEPVEGRSPSAAKVEVVVSPTDQTIPIVVVFGSDAGRRPN